MNVGNRPARRNGEKKNRDSLTPSLPLRRYGAGHVTELLLAHGKKLDDEQVGRGIVRGLRRDVTAGGDG